ncbi:MAG: hypothetical protein KAJ10_05360 [Thermodesulfovibrionia bacterium]|nr:hypothetical protein [Thermodesulfovibrionia bacterium]
MENPQLVALTVAVENLEKTVDTGFKRIESSQVKQWEQITKNSIDIRGVKVQLSSTQWAVGIILIAAGVVAAVLAG